MPHRPDGSDGGRSNGRDGKRGNRRGQGGQGRKQSDRREGQQRGPKQVGKRVSPPGIRTFQQVTKSADKGGADAPTPRGTGSDPERVTPPPPSFGDQRSGGKGPSRGGGGKHRGRKDR